MKFGVMGTGQVGRTVGEKLQSLGHDVMLGSRDPAQKQDLALKVGTIAEAALHGEWIVNALPGEKAIELLAGCALDGKIFVDIANYDLAVDQPIPTPVGEAIQSAFPSVRLVKALNSVSAHLMVDPAALGKPHSVFIASNDAAAKAEVGRLLESFGWDDIVDLGDLTACRAMEQLIPLWMRLEEKLGGPNFNLAVVRS
jgi:8-hydroxy-5-deazaflavin:NADPH oxidoreductase